MELGGTLRLADIPTVEGATFLDDPDETVLATITAPTREIEPEDEVEEGAEGAEGEAEGEQPEGAADGASGGDAAGDPGTVEG
jgi:large subunit ribosomal protein L25